MKHTGQRVVIESPLNAPDVAGIQRNLRFLLWCCRAVKLRSGTSPCRTTCVCRVGL